MALSGTNFGTPMSGGCLNYVDRRCQIDLSLDDTHPATDGLGNHGYGTPIRISAN